MISSKRSTGKKKRWHCTLSNCTLTDINNYNWKIKKVRTAKHTRVRKLCWLLLTILFKISKTPLQPIIMLPADAVMFCHRIEDLFVRSQEEKRKKNLHGFRKTLIQMCHLLRSARFPCRNNNTRTNARFPCQNNNTRTSSCIKVTLNWRVTGSW